MTNQNFEDAESPASGERTKSNKIRDAAGEAFSKASDTARDAGKTKRCRGCGLEYVRPGHGPS